MSIRGHSKIFSKHFHHLSQHKEKCFGQIQYHIHWKQAKKVISPQALLGAGRKQICRQDVEHHKALVMTWIFHVVAPSSWKRHFKSVSGWVGPKRQLCLELAVKCCEYHGAAWNPEEFDFTGSIQTNFGSHLSIIPPAIRLWLPMLRCISVGTPVKTSPFCTCPRWPFRTLKDQKHTKAVRTCENKDIIAVNKWPCHIVQLGSLTSKPPFISASHQS